MTKPPPRFAIAVSEMLVIVAIISGLWAFLLPAVNVARDDQNKPAILPALRPLYDDNPWPFIVLTPIAATGFVAIFVGVIRLVVPESVRRYFPWRSLPKPPRLPVEPIADSRPAVVTSALSISASVILIFTASHARVDRTHRRPVVTWQGPIADYVSRAAILGWLLSAIAIALGAYALTRFRSRVNFLAGLGIAIACLNLFGSCLWCGLVYED